MIKSPAAESIDIINHLTSDSSLINLFCERSGTSGHKKNMHRTRLLIVDDHEIFRGPPLHSGISFRAQEIEICGEATNGLEAIERAKQLRPGIVVLMDISMPHLDGLQATRQVSERSSEFVDSSSQST